MPRARIIPVLLISHRKMVKTCRFAEPRYLGDPLNILRIFNGKQVDEICVLDISASREQVPPSFQLIEEMAAECFMPLCYGGGIRSLDDMKRIFSLGVEKISLNSQLANRALVEKACACFGSQSLTASIDVVYKEDGIPSVYAQKTGIPTSLDPIFMARRCEEMGCGEILLNVVARDGMLCGYDTTLITEVSGAVSIPVIACGGARDLRDMQAALQAGASAAGAGSLFVLHGKHKAVLIRYPHQEQIEKVSGRRL